MRFVILALLLLSGCKSWGDKISECRDKGGTMVKVYATGSSEWRCYKLEEMK